MADVDDAAVQEAQDIVDSESIRVAGEKHNQARRDREEREGRN